MKFDIESYLDKGASIQDNLLRKRYEQIDDLFDELSLKKYDAFLLKLIVSGDVEAIEFKGPRSGEFVVEYRYPLSEFVEVGLKEKGDFLTSLILNALTALYESEGMDISEIEMLKSKYIS